MFLKKNLKSETKPKMISRKNPCDFFRHGTGEKVEDDGPHLFDLKQPLKPIWPQFVCQ